MYTDLLRLSIKYISSIYAARASQSSAVPQTAEEGQIVFSGGVYVGKHTSQDASVRAKASARSGLHPLEKMLAFLRSVSKFFDTLKSRDPDGSRLSSQIDFYISFTV